MTTATKTPQDLMLDLMRMSSFNAFDGDLVVDSLLEYRHLWQGAIFDRAAYFTLDRYNEGVKTDPIDFIKLRDIGAGYWNVDTLYLLPSEDTTSCRARLERLARTWAADEVDWINGCDAGPHVLRVWWD
jgi:hypothetical protein